MPWRRLGGVAAEGANRVAQVIGSVISIEQSAFIKGRQILDGVLMVNEVVRWAKLKKQKMMSFKVDFEKAYDSVSWAYLDRLIKWDKSNIDLLLRVLKWFHLASGLQLNLHKSKLGGIGVSEAQVRPMAEVSGCEAEALPFKYLGLPVGANMSRVGEWDNLMGRFYKRLSQWKMKFLSIGGRLTLLKSVLGSLGEGGLWRSLIRNCYGLDAGFNSDLVATGGGVWGGIVQIVKKLHFDGIIPLNSISRLVHNGENTKFWNHVWCGGNFFALMFPRLYALASNKRAMVADYRANGEWNFQWRVTIRSGAIQEQLDHLLLQLEMVHFQGGQDAWRWDLSTDGMFSVKSVRSHIDLLCLPAINVETRWIKYLPRKVNVFLWRLLLNRLPTRWELGRRGVPLDVSMCPVCETTPEQVDHLFFGCGTIAMDLWEKLR
ncbi:hypothetical protein LXL04_037569 [Taraxacum kok-saghyz]